MERGRDRREGGQRLRCVVAEISQFAGVGGPGSGTETEVVELDVAARPGEFLGGQLGAESDGGVDGHAMLSFRGNGGAVAGYRSAAFGGFGQFVVGGVTVTGVEDVEDCQISEGHRGADRRARTGVRVSHDG